MGNWNWRSFFFDLVLGLLVAAGVGTYALMMRERALACELQVRRAAEQLDHATLENVEMRREEAEARQQAEKARELAEKQLKAGDEEIRRRKDP